MFGKSFYFAAASLYVQLCAGQVGNPIPIPVVSGAAGGVNQCGGCYVVADVAGIVFGSETLTAVQTNSVIVASGFNGTFTTTSIVFDEGQFTFGSTGLAAPAATGPVTALNTGQSTLVLSGVTLTSPTQYDIFTAYSLTSTISTNGACVVVAGTPIPVSPAFSVAIPPGVDPSAYLPIAEASFVSFKAPPSCTAGGDNFGQTTHVPIALTTTQVTVTSKATLQPQPVSVASSGTVGSTTTALPTPTSAVATSTVATSTVATSTAPNVTVVTSVITSTGPAVTPSTFIAFSPIANATQVTFLPNGTGSFTVPLIGSNSIQTAGVEAIRNTQIGAWLAGAVAVLMGLVG